MTGPVDWLLPRALRPVGEPIQSSGSPWQPPDDIEPLYYRTGTAALAAVLSGYARASAVTATPEILMPAYTCPDVVSAIAAAGAKARLVELQSARPWLDLESLDAAVTDRTIALVAINFQGIDEQVAALRAWCDSAGLPLIYDHCQAFPATDEATALSDALVFSHGRGKPACALAGGSVWLHRSRARISLPGPSTYSDGANPLKRLAYNLLIRPRLYGALLKVPGLGIGETVFHELGDIEGLSEAGITQIRTAIAAHLNLTDFEARRQALTQAVSGLDGWTDLPTVCHAPSSRPLLRYTLLAPDAETRDRALVGLQAAGLGATQLYPSTVASIDGVAPHLAPHDPHSNATDFAGRLLTLPCHSDVTDADIARMVQLISRA